MKKSLSPVVIAVVSVVILLLGQLLIATIFDSRPDTTGPTMAEELDPQAMMVLIEFQQTEGLANMVNAMNERGIKGLLMMSPDFAEANATDLKAILQVGNLEIIASYVKAPLWGMSYEEQKTVITDTVSRVEAALDTEIRIVGSRYMASDEVTLQVAEEMEIEYVTARGTTELALTVYKPDDYDVKILSISNIDTPEFKYGSLCDYSYYERAGNPEDILADLTRATEETKFVGVSHTYIGGYKERWHDMWLEFWDTEDIDWVGLDDLGTVDKYLPMWQIPINKNAPYTPEKIRPLIPYKEETNVANPCAIEEL